MTSLNHQNLILLFLILMPVACQPNTKGDDCRSNEDDNCVCTLPSGESCLSDEVDCECILVENLADSNMSLVDEGVDDEGMINDQEIMRCEGIECEAGSVCDENTGLCGACTNQCEEANQRRCDSDGHIITCEEQGLCLRDSEPQSCTENRVCQDRDGQASCVCGMGLIDDGQGNCSESGGWRADVVMITLDANGQGMATADFAEGQSQDLGEWGTPSGSGCWPSSQRFNFWDGKPRFFTLSESVGAWKNVTITVTPQSEELDPEVFAYLMPSSLRTTPPETDGIGMCKTSYSASSLGNAGETEIITFDTYGTFEPQQLMIGVANESMGRVTVRIEVQDIDEQCVGDNPSPTAWPPYVQKIDLNQELDMYTRRGLIRSNLDVGATMCDLDWVSEQFCDVMTQAVYYEGHHVMFSFDQPESSLQVVRVTPDPGVEVTLWGYAQGTSNFTVPPAASGIACEVSHPTDGLERPTNPGESESIEFYAFGNPYHNLIGVSGFSEDGQEGGFTVTVDQYLSAGDACEEDDFSRVQGLENWAEATDVNLIALAEGLYTAMGDLSQGSALCGLSWMSNAYCVPETQFHYFGGHHVFYALEEPLAPGEQVEIEVIPAPNVEVSLYGYQMGTTNFSVPPVVSSSVCEASHRHDLRHRPGYGEIERIKFMNPSSNPNAYNVFFGVAGYTENWPPQPDDLGIGDEGAFHIQVSKTTPPPAHCEASLPGTSYVAWPEEVNLMNLNDQNQASIQGNLATGRCMNLDFAEDIYCFPSTQNQHFEGNHVFYAVDQPMPPNSIMRITVNPDPNVEVNLYGYNMPAHRYSVPPMVRDAVGCEASYPLSGIQHTPNPGEPEMIEFQNPTNHEYTVFFAVAGDDQTGITGAYTVDVELTVSEPHCPQSLEGEMSDNDWPDRLNLISLTDGEAQASGELADGECVNLDFAEEAFCFPGTQNQHFQGNHVFFALDTPQPTNSVLTITVVPDPDVEVSLYGWQAAPNDYTVPPMVNTTICEASYTQNGIEHRPNPGVAETIRFYNPSSNPNQYGIFFAVAGDRDTGTAGQFNVIVSLDVGETFCEESLARSVSSCWPSDVTMIPRGTIEGNLSEGACTNLGWADNASVACFPSTESDMFDGHHVFYALAEPMAPNSELSITASPGSGTVDLSLYALMMGENQCFVPPNVGGVVSCEASYPPFNVTNPGLPERLRLTNPTGNHYQVLIGVAGANEADSGNFSLTVEER
jgi:hypothetical protein